MYHTHSGAYIQRTNTSISENVMAMGVAKISKSIFLADHSPYRVMVSCDSLSVHHLLFHKESDCSVIGFVYLCMNKTTVRFARSGGARWLNDAYQTA